MAQSSVPNGKTSPKPADDALPLRRSGRVRKKPSNNGEDADYRDQSSVASPSSATARRNPKRKAAAEVLDVPDNLLEASLGPWKENEQAEWASWTELESDPVGLLLLLTHQLVLLLTTTQAFFTGILGLLGVKGAKIEEVLSVDEDSLAALP